MSFQWLQMRITEEKERRQREAMILGRLPRAVQDLHACLSVCIESYNEAFGPHAADVILTGPTIRILVREERDNDWHARGKVEITGIPALPGFSIERANSEPIQIEVGLLPGDRIFYRDRAVDQYLTMEELTKRILDRVFFPKLKE